MRFRSCKSGVVSEVILGYDPDLDQFEGVGEAGARRWRPGRLPARLETEVLDGLDGRVARMTRTQSAFGAEYDSLSDMVCFGAAPALIMRIETLLFWFLASMLGGIAIIYIERNQNELIHQLFHFRIGPNIFFHLSAVHASPTGEIDHDRLVLFFRNF